MLLSIQIVSSLIRPFTEPKTSNIILPYLKLDKKLGHRAVVLNLGSWKCVHIYIHLYNEGTYVIQWVYRIWSRPKGRQGSLCNTSTLQNRVKKCTFVKISADSNFLRLSGTIHYTVWQHIFRTFSDYILHIFSLATFVRTAVLYMYYRGKLPWRIPLAGSFVRQKMNTRLIC